MIEVTRGQWHVDSTKPTLVIHVIKRIDITKERAMEVIQHALVDVFGKKNHGAELDYRDVKEVKKRMGDNNMIKEPHDSMTIIFPPGPIVYTRKPEAVRDLLTHAVAKWHEASAGW